MPSRRSSLPGEAVVVSVNRCRASRSDWAPRSWALRSTTGRHDVAATVGRANTHQQHQHRVHGRQQGHGDGQAEDPASGGEHRHVHVVEREDLLAEHRQAVQVLGPLLMRDRRDVCLQPRDVGLQRDRHLVAEAALHPGGDGHHQPGGDGGDCERDDRELQQARLMLEQPFAEQLEPDREQRIRHRRDQGEDERGAHEGRLVAIAEPAQPPHRGQRGGQACRRAPRRVRRGHRRPPPPRLPLASRSRTGCACSVNIVQYLPRSAISSSWLPSSATAPCSMTAIRSACRTVENRCEIRIVVHDRVAARTRSKISASPRTSS